MPPPAHADVALSRRTVAITVVGGVAALALSGCTEDSIDLPGLPTPDPGPDAAAVREALRVEERLAGAVRRARRQHAALRGPLRGTARVHEAHVDLLRPAVEDPGPPARGPALRGRPGAVLDELVARETAARRAHLTALADVESGPLARLLAGMAAASAQQARLLDRLTVPEQSR